MPSPTFTSLHARIRQLEADNASLSHAASEAASLAEECAADAAAYRRLRPADQALVTELTDATRRKDRRIQRLTSLLEAERSRVQGLEGRITELEEMLQVADETERVLQLSLNVTEKGKAEGDRRNGLWEKEEKGEKEAVRVWEVVIKSLKEYFPRDIIGEDFAAFEAFRAGVVVIEMAKRLRAWLGPGAYSWAHGFFAVLEEACLAVDDALRWCFEEPGARGAQLVEAVTALEERFNSVVKEVNSGETVQWTESYANMKIGLFRMAAESVMGVTSRKFDGRRSIAGIDALVDDVQSALARRGAEVRAKLKAASGSGAGGLEGLTAVRAKLDASKSVLRRKTSELEDLRVRANVFEERILTALEESKELSTLRTRVTELEAELAREKSTHSENRDISQLPSDDGVDPKAIGVNGVGSDFRHSEGVDNTNEAARLRRILVRRHLADLQPLTFHESIYQHKAEEEAKLQRSMRQVLEEARLSASNSAAVELDAETLKPKAQHITKVSVCNTVSWGKSRGSKISITDREADFAGGAQFREVSLGRVGREVATIITSLAQSYCQ